MSYQLDIDEQTSKWTMVGSDGERLRKLHISSGMSVFEIAYKFDVPVEEVKERLRYFDIYIDEPLDWKEDEDVLEKVAENGDERAFSKLLDSGVASNHVKNRIEMYDIKSYGNDYRDAETLRAESEEANSVEEVADTFRVHPETINRWSKKHFGKSAVKVIEEGVSKEEKVTQEEDADDGTETILDLGKVVERSDVNSTVSVEDGVVVADISLELDDIIKISEEERVEIMSKNDIL